MAKNDILPVFIPHGGCSHRCIFCDQQQISGCDHLPNQAELERMIPPDFPADGTLAFYGGSFTALPPKVMDTYLAFAARQKTAGKIGAIRLSTHPVYIDAEIVQHLLFFGVDCVELGVQSLDDAVLRKAGRGHGSKDVFAAMSLLAASPLRWGVQLMVGLPLDTEAKDITSVLEIAPFAPDLARIYPLLVIRDTPLAAMWREGAYTPLALADAVAVTAKMYALFSYYGIPVIRMGLQPTAELNTGSASLLAGPFHPSFGHLVRSYLKGEQMHLAAKGHEADAIRFLAPKNDLPLLFGDGRANIEKLAGGRKIAVSPADLPAGAVVVAAYAKEQKAQPFALLTEGEFLEKFTEIYRRTYCT